MLNINQNFDLKAPVFNFDRDYFNSVEELEAYDTSNVPNHFVTNVAGMLYQFTNGKWLPMISTTSDDPENPEDHVHYVNLIDSNCYVSRSPDSNKYTFCALGENTSLTMSNEPGVYLYTNIDNAACPRINLTQETNEIYKYLQIGMTDDGPFGLDIQNKTSGNIQILTDAILTDEEEEDGCSLVDISLTENNNRTHINARGGFLHKTDDGYKTSLNAYQLRFSAPYSTHTSAYFDDGMISYERSGYRTLCISGGIVNSTTNPSGNGTISFGEDKKFKFSRPINNEGGVISGIKSLTAFANPSATKVWATDGSTVDLSTKANVSDLDAKANKSDVLLKKSASGGYYIEENSNTLGQKAFATSDTCIASGNYSHAEGNHTNSIGNYSHAEGTGTASYGLASHSEGCGTAANGYCSHAQGYYNITDANSIHSVGIGNNASRKNAEYIYAKNNSNNTSLVDDPKNGYKYLIGVGGYDGISTDNTTYKSVQEVIADLTARIEQLETKVKALEDANTPA